MYNDVNRKSEFNLTMSLQILYVLETIFLNKTATNEIYTQINTLPLHDALPVWCRWSTAAHAGAQRRSCRRAGAGGRRRRRCCAAAARHRRRRRSEEQTSELQSLMRMSYAVLCLKKQKKQLLTLRRYNPTLNLLSRSHDEIASGKKITIN